MPYLTSMEQLAREEGVEKGIEQGIAQGIAQGVRDSIIRTLKVRFGQVPAHIADWLGQCEDVAVLQRFHQQSLEANTVEDLTPGETNHESHESHE